MRAIAHAKLNRRLHADRIYHHGDQEDEQHDNRAGEKRALHFHGSET